MILAEYGILTLVGSALAAMMLVVVPSWGIYKKNTFLMQQALYYVYLQWILCVLAFLCLVIAFFKDDFQISYVYNHSSRQLPWFYKGCAVWGGHEGSMLLWVCLLQTWTMLAAYFSRSLAIAYRIRILITLGAISLVFLSFILWTSNPFITDYYHVFQEGHDLNPLLQDIGFLLHPPILYVGYVGFTVAFAVAFSILWLGEWDKTCITWVRSWILASWCTLTLGITLGSWWAYRELGWGGFWFWDPVENASFMPWLAGCALIHSMCVADKREGLKVWVLLLCIIVFALSLIGAFLVRSGVLTSVHTFALSPQRGLYILIMFLSIVYSSLILYAYRIRQFVSTGLIYIFSREMSLLLNNVFLIVAVSTVLLGTIYPLMIEGLGLGKLSVGAPYFNIVFMPFMLPLLFLMGFVALKWGQNTLLPWIYPLCGLGIFMLLAICIAFYTRFKFFLISLSMILSGWVLWMTIKALLNKPQIRLTTIAWSTAHVGVAITAIGITCASGFGLQQDSVMAPGDKIQFAGLPIYFDAISTLNGPNYHGVRAHFKVNHHKIYPEKRIYEVGKIPMTDAAIDVTLWRDIYVALGDPVGKSHWHIRLYYKPLVRCIWLGGILMFLGGLLASIKRFIR